MHVSKLLFKTHRNSHKQFSILLVFWVRHITLRSASNSRCVLVDLIWDITKTHCDYSNVFLITQSEEAHSELQRYTTIALSKYIVACDSLQRWRFNVKRKVGSIRTLTKMRRQNIAINNGGPYLSSSPALRPCCSP
jgi:hypothetical protein